MFRCAHGAVTVTTSTSGPSSSAACVPGAGTPACSRCTASPSATCVARPRPRVDRRGTKGRGGKAVPQERPGGEGDSSAYGEPVQVRARPDGRPVRFVWRSRLYTVRAILEHWVINREWWREPADPGDPGS